jgi:hypothetical protein
MRLYERYLLLIEDKPVKLSPTKLSKATGIPKHRYQKFLKQLTGLEEELKKNDEQFKKTLNNLVGKLKTSNEEQAENLRKGMEIIKNRKAVNAERLVNVRSKIQKLGLVGAGVAAVGTAGYLAYKKLKDKKERN